MVFGFGNRNAGLEELREKMDLEVSFWKRQLDKCVHEKDYWLAMAYAAQRQVRVLEAHHRMQQEQQTQLSGQLENAQKRLAQCTCGLVTSRVMAPPPEPLPSPPRDANAPESEAVKKLKLKLLSVEAQLKKADVLARRGEDRSDALGQEVSRLRSELECARCTISAHAHEADQLRKQLVAARGLGDDTAGQAAWLAIELQKAQATVQQLRAELTNKDEMLGLLRLQLSDYVAAVGGSQCPSGTTTPTMLRESLAGAVNAKLLSLLTPRSTLGSNGGYGNNTPRSALTPHALTPRASDQNSGKGTFHRSNTEPNLAAEDGPSEFRTSSSTNQKPPSLDFTFLHDQPATGVFSAVRATPSTPNVGLPTSREGSGQSTTARRLSQLQQSSLVPSHQLCMTDSEAQGGETARSYDFTPITQADFAPYLPCPSPKLLASQPLRASSSETESDVITGGPATTGTTTGPATVSAGSSSRAASPEPTDSDTQPANTHDCTLSDTQPAATQDPALSDTPQAVGGAAAQQQGLAAGNVYGSEIAPAAFTVGSSGPASDAEGDGGSQRRMLTPQITLAAGCRDLADVLLQSLTGDSSAAQQPGSTVLLSGASADHASEQPGAAAVLGDVGSMGVTSLSDGGPLRSSDTHQHDAASTMATVGSGEQDTPRQPSMRGEDAAFEQDGNTLLGSPISAVVQLSHEVDRDDVPGEGETCEGGCRPERVYSQPPLNSAGSEMPVELRPAQVAAEVSTAHEEPVFQLRATTQAPAPAGAEAGEGAADFNVANIRARFAAFEMSSEQKPLTPGAVGSQSLRVKPQVHPCARTGTSGITHRLGSLRERMEQ